jgi:signal transduction histidine kinase
MGIIRADRILCRGSTYLGWTAALAGLVLASPSAAQSLPTAAIGNLHLQAGDVVWAAITVGMALAALFSFALLIRNRRDSTLAAARGELVALRSALDRTEALLDADDQRTIVWDSAVAPPQVFGGLPERVGAPADRAAFLALDRWLDRDAAQEVETAADKLRRNGDAFALAVRAKSGALLEVTGRTSGRRAVMRMRELTGERRSFAELREQAGIVMAELTALRSLCDALPFPLWRRNRAGRLVWVNAAYVSAVEAAGLESVLNAGIELLPSRTRDSIRETERAGGTFRDSAVAIVSGDRRRLQVVDLPLEEGSVGCAVDVSEVEAIRLELQQVTQSSARTLDQLAAGVAVFDKDARLQFHNAAYRALWDLPADFLLSRPEESTILDKLRAERKLPEQANYRDWRSRHLAGYRSAEKREELLHLPDGRTLRMTALPEAEGGLTYIYENVTEQIALESRHKALLQLQGETLDHLSEAVAVFGTDARLRLFNPVFAELWRLSPAKLREEPHVSEIIAECQAIYPGKTHWDDIRTAVTDLERDDRATGRMQRPDGSVVDYATVALPEGMTMLTFVDVTDSARIQRVLSERNEALEAAGRLKSDFIQHVSYELRSPLTSIIGFAEMLSDETAGGLNPTQREYMDHIASSSSSLLAIINDILDLATVDAGIMSLDIRETDVAAVARSAVEGLRDRLAEQKIELEISIPRNAGKFHVDESRVRQILFNLISNAIRFSNAGGKIQLKASRRKDWIVYTVKDNGVGIPEDIMPNVFQAFEAHGSHGRRSGAGLGLSIVKSLVELHGGDVEIQSVEGKGTTATVRLPILPTAAAAAAE